MIPVLRSLSRIADRGIAKLELAEFSPVSLIVGANNAGKSSILEAAGIALRPWDPVREAQGQARGAEARRARRPRCGQRRHAARWCVRVPAGVDRAGRSASADRSGR